MSPFPTFGKCDILMREWRCIGADKGKMLNNELTYSYELDNFKLQTYSEKVHVCSG